MLPERARRRPLDRGIFAGTLVLTALLASAIQADVVTFTIGDKDGFSLGTVVGQQFDPQPIANYWLGAPTGWNGDGDGTDVWKHTPGGLDTYIFSFHYADVPKVDATVTLFHGGTAVDARLFLDGVDIGGLTPGEGPGRLGDFARLDAIDLSPFLGLIDGDDAFEIKTIQGDDLVVDYISLAIAVPESPRGMFVLATMMSWLVISARARRGLFAV
jgi:hypothetical protein